MMKRLYVWCVGQGIIPDKSIDPEDYDRDYFDDRDDDWEYDNYRDMKEES